VGHGFGRAFAVHGQGDREKRRKDQVCIMEMNPDQHAAVMYQAIAHNLSTVDRDIDLLVKIAEQRKDITSAQLVSVIDGQRRAHDAYATFLALFGEAVGDYVADDAGHVHDHDGNHNHGNERSPLSLVEAAKKFTDQAHAYETR
jgi:predicted DNA-binding ribbon-helix-helix protein